MSFKIHTKSRLARTATFTVLMLALQSASSQPAINQSATSIAAQRAVTTQSILSAPVGVYRRLAKNGGVEEEVINASSGGRAVLRQLRYYDDGKVKQQLEWANGKLNGTSRLYLPDGSVFREADYQNDQILTFTEYRQKLVYNQITADTRTIVHRGKRISLRWDKYYEVIQKKKRMMGYTRDSLIVFLLANGTTEQATQTLSDLNSLYQSKASGQLADANAVVACENGKSGVANDLGLNNATFRTASASRGKGAATTGGGQAAMATVQGAVSSVSSACGSGTSGAGGGRLPGISTPRDAQIAAAQGALDQAIQACNASSPGFGNDQIAIGGFKSVSAAVEMAMAEAEAAQSVITRTGLSATEGSAIIEASATESAAMRTAATAVTESGPTIIRGFITAGAAEVILAVGVGAVAGGVIGTVIDQSPIGQALTSAVATAQELFDADYQEEARKADEAQKAAAARDAANKGGQPAGAPSVGRPNPDGQGGDKCASMENLKRTCEITNWTARSCAAFSAIVSGCKGDATRVQFGSEGDVSSLACPSNEDTAALRAQKQCEQQGLIGQPGPDGAISCGVRQVDRDSIQSGPNPGQINPTRGE